jgi:hypothetical protein
VENDTIYLLVVRHNDEDTHIEGAFSTPELAKEARDFLKQDFANVPFRILKITLDPNPEDLL